MRAIDQTGVISTVVGVCGEPGNSGDEGAASELLLDRPYGLGVIGERTLYVADTHNHRLLAVGL